MIWKPFSVRLVHYQHQPTGTRPLHQCVWQHSHQYTTTRCHSWHDSGTKRQDSILGCHHLAQPQCCTMGECTRQSIDKTEGMEQEEPVHPQSHTHCAYHDSAHCGRCALSSTSTNTCTVSVGEEHHRVLVE